MGFLGEKTQKSMKLPSTKFSVENVFLLTEFNIVIHLFCKGDGHEILLRQAKTVGMMKVGAHIICDGNSGSPTKKDREGNTFPKGTCFFYSRSIAERQETVVIPLSRTNGRVWEHIMF